MSPNDFRPYHIVRCRVATRSLGLVTVWDGRDVINRRGDQPLLFVSFSLLQ